MTKIKELKPIQSKGKWHYRELTITITNEDNTTQDISGIMWRTDKAALELLDGLFSSAAEVDYTLTQDGETNKLQVFEVHKEEEKKSYGKSEEEKDYWKRKEERDVAKFEYDMKRQSINDKKIEWQTLAKIVQEFIQPDVNNGALTVEQAIDKLVEQTNNLYNRVNPKNG